MSIEKPISTIRKAVQGSAEEIAANEYLEKPEERHYRETLNFFRFIKIFEPERYEQFVKIGAQGKELKDEMGAEKYKIFSRILREVTERDASKMKEAGDQIKSSNLPSEELSQEILELNTRYLKEKMEELKNDSRIASAFSGQEELLNRSIDFAITSMLDLYSAYDKSPNLRPIKKEEAKNLFTKFIKFLRDID